MHYFKNINIEIFMIIYSITMNNISRKYQRWFESAHWLKNIFHSIWLARGNWDVADIFTPLIYCWGVCVRSLVCLLAFSYSVIIFRDLKICPRADNIRNERKGTNERGERRLSVSDTSVIERLYSIIVSIATYCFSKSPLITDIAHDNNA